MTKALKSHWASILVSLIILVLCNLPKSATGNVAGFFFLGVDKVVHLGMFFCLACVLIISEILRQKRISLTCSSLIYILIFCFLYGAFIEYLQYSVFTYRAAELWDWICDATGALMSAGFYLILDVITRKYLSIPKRFNREN